MKTLSTNLRTLIILSITLSLLIGVDYLNAWTKPSSNPPNGNVATPVNTSSTLQVKIGPLGTGNLAVTGIQSITHNNPILRFTDLNEMDHRIVVNGNAMWFQVDRNDDGILGPYGPTAADGRQTLVLNSSSTSAGDYALFSNQVRAYEYCDRGGNNCARAGTFSLPVCRKGESLIADANGDWTCYTPPSPPPPPPPVAFNWYQAPNQQCSTFCSSIGKKSMSDPKWGTMCVSGEAALDPVNGIPMSYPYGVWGGMTGDTGGHFQKQISGYKFCPNGTMGRDDTPCTPSNPYTNNYCYANGQKQDYDGTDLSVGCYCG